MPCGWFWWGFWSVLYSVLEYGCYSSYITINGLSTLAISFKVMFKLLALSILTITNVLIVHISLQSIFAVPNYQIISSGFLCNPSLVYAA